MAIKFTPISFLIRLLAAFGLVSASYNPIDPYSFYQWAIIPVLNDFSSLTPLHGLVGVALIIIWVIFLRATSRSLGVIGVILTAALFTMLIWVFLDQGWLSLQNKDVMSWIIIVAISTVLAIGMSWSHIRRRMSGQLDVDETDDS